MRPLYVFLLCVFFLSCSFSVRSQQAAAVDSIKQALSRSTTLEQRFYWTDVLQRTLMNVNIQEADEYGKKLIEMAEESRDRKLMVRAYLANGIRCTYLQGTMNFTRRAIDYFNQALEITQFNGMDEQRAAVLLRLAAVTLVIPDPDKSLAYVSRAASILETVDNDSLRVEVQNTLGDIYLSKNDKTLALSHYLNGLHEAENARHPNPTLLRTAYSNLSGFYSDIEDYDRAIDYASKAMEQLDYIHERSSPYQRAIDLNNIGKLYAAKKNSDLAITYFKRSLALADSMKFSTLKIPAYSSMLDQYLRSDQPQQALQFFNSAEGMELRKYLTGVGLSANIDMAFGGIFTRLERYDSAVFYFNRAAPYYENQSNPFGSMFFFLQRGVLYKKMGDTKKAIELFSRARELADRVGNLDIAQRAVKNLDTLYQDLGDYRQAARFNAEYYQYKDSIQTLGKQKELAQLEAADEQLRQKKFEEEKAEQKRKRDNIQYMAITIGIVCLFLALVTLGMFKVSKTMIRMIGFFAFLMFFEFVFLIFKKNIHAVTEGEPLKDLAFMILLAALLLPLHHWLEHKVIHYLTSHNRLTAAGHHLKTKLFRRGKTGEK